MNKTYTFHVHGMHCKACTLLIEDTLGGVQGVERVSANLGKHEVKVTGNFLDRSESEIATLLTEPIASHGYVLSVEKEKKVVAWNDLRDAAILAVLFIIMFIALQKMGILSFSVKGSVSYGAAFMVGIIASLSSCLAVVGGLLLSMSATFAKEGDPWKPQVLFHVGRIISFFVLGGVIGMVGATFSFGVIGLFIMSFLIGLTMLVLGINLLDVFPWAKRLQPSMPRFIARRVHGVSSFNHRLTPFLVGVATFFLPCGFTQSMQLYTLTTGTFMTGALTMLFFALGTLPVLTLISFSSYKIGSGRKSSIFFKTAGFIVILFALFNIMNSLVVAGLIPPLFSI